MSTESRKADHLRICVEKNVSSSHNYFDDISMIHECLPELDLDKIDTSVELFGKKLQVPIIIASMTGGTAEAKKINENLAIACQNVGVGLGLGSQRAALENPKLEETFKVRHLAKDIFIYANVGAVQLNYGYGVEKYKKAVPGRSFGAVTTRP